MRNFQNKNDQIPFRKKKYGQNSNSREKIFLTFLVLFIFRFGNTIPLAGIDQDAVQKSFLQFENKNSIMQILSLYSGGRINTLTSFSLGIIPFINASILVDLVTALFPSLEKLQSEEGEQGKKKLTFYKKIITVVFSFLQSSFLVFYLKPYFYANDFFSFGVTILELMSGSMIIVWLSNLIEKRGIGNGPSLIILTNIILGFIGKIPLLSWSFDILSQIAFLLFLISLICISQTARIRIDVVSARQLALFESIEKTSFRKKKIFQLKENGLSIRLNQAGIFPIIIASNLLPLFSLIFTYFFGEIKYLNTIVYYLLVLGFNYFYTLIFWDPVKIAEQLRKASVSIVNVTPGKETISYLENVVRSTSLLGGIFLCLILFFYDIVKQSQNRELLNQLNISSLIIVVGVAYEMQKSLQALSIDRVKDLS